MISDELPSRNEVKSCNMCRAALHKLCERNDGGICECDCSRGF